MQAIAVVPGTTRVHLVDRPEPDVSAADQIKLRVLAVGICGTDREEAAGGRCRAPEGHDDLVLGHEMLGQVLEVGRAVTRVAPGDHAVFTVRRGCGHCLACAMNRSDMCQSGEYRERGIVGLDGYQTPQVVDQEQYVVRVPPELAAIGVVLEPLSVAEKAIDEAVRLQVARLPEAPAHLDFVHGRRCLVAGLGPIGLLAALVLRLRGAQVWGLDVVDPGTPRPAWLAAVGGHYVDGRTAGAAGLTKAIGPMDLIFEATGIASLEFSLLESLAVNGAYVLTGIPGGDRPTQLDAPALIRQLVLNNQVMLGSVNAARNHFQMAVDDLAHAQLAWPGQIAKLITHRHRPDDFAGALAHHGVDEIKTIIDWSGTP